MSQVQQGAKNGMYGKTHTDETKKRLSLISSARRHTEETKIKIAQANKGKIVSEETKIKIRLAAKNKKKFFSEEQVAVILTDTRTQREIAKSFNVHESTISKIKNGKYNKNV